MNWTLAVEKNRDALKRILAMLVAMLEVSGVRRNTLPRHLHRYALSLLRPAEAATRRLIIVAARGLEVRLPPLRKPKQVPVHDTLGLANMVSPGQAVTGAPAPSRPTQRTLSLPLLDPLKRFGVPRPYAKPAIMPSTRLLGGDPIVPLFRRPEPAPPPPPSPDDPLDAVRIRRRLEAIGRALEDLPRQAERLARWEARRDARLAQERSGDADAGKGDASRATAGAQLKTRFQRPEPMRPGRPPGWHRKPDHDIDDVLNDVHGLAVWARDGPGA